MKECFSQLVLTKKELYGFCRPRGMTCEEWIMKYLEDEVKSEFYKSVSFLKTFLAIWPPGWMTIKQLAKYATIGSESFAC